MKNYLIIPAVLIISGLNLTAQNSVNNIALPELQKNHSRTIINVPDLEDYFTMKCDLHMHTIFSDGVVWPTIRVREAWEEGLDAIAITDHTENNPSKQDVGGDDNSSYNIAFDAAKDYNILLIKGTEITREMPPGHFNALFIKDANRIDVTEAVDALMEAHNQGGFIIWNHPGWKAQQPDTCIRFDIHNKLISERVINGIEVFNEAEWYPIALNWCIEDNLAVFGNSDIHDVNGHYYPLSIFHRPMTLIFTKEKSLDGIREALDDRRSVAWFSKYLTGPEPLLSGLYNKSVSVRVLNEKDSMGRSVIEVKNNSDFHFEFEPVSGKAPEFIVRPNSVVLIRINDTTLPDEFQYHIKNWFTDMNKNLKVVIKCKKS